MPAKRRQLVKRRPTTPVKRKRFPTSSRTPRYTVSGTGPKRFSLDIIEESVIYNTINYANFVVVAESVYSSVRPFHFIQINKILHKHFKNPRFIIDATSHIGGSLVNMMMGFPRTRFMGIELKKNTYNALVTNVKTFGISTRVSLWNANCIPVLKKLSGKCRVKPEFINYDPPWGGPGYTRIKKLMLSLKNTTGRNVPLYEIINDTFARKLTKYATFKAPVNFDMEKFKAKVHGKCSSYIIKSSNKKPAYYYMVVKMA